MAQDPKKKPKVPAWIGGQQAPNASPNVPAWVNNPASASWAKWNQPGALLYKTGENERKTAYVNGQKIRMAPNTTVYRPQRKQEWLQKFISDLTGRGNSQPSGVTSVRG